MQEQRAFLIDGYEGTCASATHQSGAWRRGIIQELNDVSQSNNASKLEVPNTKNESRLNFRTSHAEAIHEPLKITLKHTHLSVPTAIY
jgi:hypothetical protein